MRPTAPPAAMPTIGPTPRAMWLELDGAAAAPSPLLDEGPLLPAVIVWMPGSEKDASEGEETGAALLPAPAPEEAGEEDALADEAALEDGLGRFRLVGSGPDLDDCVTVTGFEDTDAGAVEEDLPPSHGIKLDRPSDPDPDPAAALLLGGVALECSEDAATGVLGLAKKPGYGSAIIRGMHGPNQALGTVKKGHTCC